MWERLELVVIANLPYQMAEFHVEKYRTGSNF
jgi:hypothetical protein